MSQGHCKHRIFTKQLAKMEIATANKFRKAVILKAKRNACKVIIISKFVNPSLDSIRSRIKDE